MIEIVINGELRQVASETTLAELVRALQLTPQQVAVELNERLVPRSEHASRKLVVGDKLEIVTLVGGG